MKVFSLHDKLAEGPGSFPGQQISREGNAKRKAASSRYQRKSEDLLQGTGRSARRVRLNITQLF